MNVRIVASGLLIGVTVLAVGGATAQSQPSGVQQYKLQPGSNFVTGCFGPCLCPDLLSRLQGTFSLQQVGFDPLFTYYRVGDVRWTVTGVTSNLTILGSGTYKVGGEFAVQHQMSLDLSVDGGALQHFDSGLKLGGGEFPANRNRYLTSPESGVHRYRDARGCRRPRGHFGGHGIRPLEILLGHGGAKSIPRTDRPPVGPRSLR